MIIYIIISFFYRIIICQKKLTLKMDWLEGHRYTEIQTPHLTLATSPAPLTGGQYRHYRNNQKYVFSLCCNLAIVVLSSPRYVNCV